MSIRMLESVRLAMKRRSEETEVSLERLWADAAREYLVNHRAIEDGQRVAR